MKIEEIEIEKYGFWNDLRYRFQDERITVVYGPNGSGKSTLAQLMIRMILHGDKNNRFLNVNDPQSSVRFHLAHKNMQFVVQQNSTQNPLRVLLAGDESSNIVPPKHFFDSVFCTDSEPDLLELLETICNNKEIESFIQLKAVASRLFQNSENPEVQRILKIHRELFNKKKRWFDASQKSGKLVDLLHEYEELQKQAESVAHQTETHRKSRTRCEHLKENLQEHETRLAGMQRQLRGHKYLQLVHAPWIQVQSIEEELSELPEIKNFPQNGLQKLNAIEADLEEQKNLCKHSQQEILQGELERDSLRQEMLNTKQLRVLKRYKSRGNWFANCQKQLDVLQEKKLKLEEKTNRVLEDLGENWTIERLLEVCVSPSSHSELLKVGQKYQNSLARRARYRKKYKRTLAKYRSLTQEQDVFLTGWGIENIETALRETRETLDSIDEFSKLKVRAREYKHQIVGIREQLRRMEISLSLPPWVQAILIGIGSVGGLLAVLGFVFGLQTSGLIGTIYALLGATCLGTSWALKTHFQCTIRQGVDLLYDELQEKEFRLKETERTLNRLQERSIERKAEFCNEPSETRTIRLIVKKLAMLEKNSLRFKRNDMRRLRLTKMRNRLQTIQKETDENRQRWCRQLEAMGLQPSLNVQRAYTFWLKVGEARELAEDWNLLEKNIEVLKGKKRDRENKFRETHRKIFGEVERVFSLDEILHHWQKTLHRQRDLRSNRQVARKQIEQSQEQFRSVRIKMEELQSQRSAIMLQAGAVDYEDFLKRATAFNQREELSELLDLAGQELEQAAQSEKEFAVSQEDLEVYIAEVNDECLETLSREIEDLRDDIAVIEEDFASTEAAILKLENDRTSSEIRFSLTQKRDEIRNALSCWISSQISSKAMSEVKNNFEKKSQMPAIHSATRFLEKISSGAFCKLWAPLESDSLKIENRDEDVFELTQLSAGFREQVALAIRLTLLESMMESGECYPVLWDDLFPHMDEEHTDVAIDVLLSTLPEDQQVIYFTCHQHTKKLFQNRGVPVWNLPTPQAHIVPHRKVG